MTARRWTLASAAGLAGALLSAGLASAANPTEVATQPSTQFSGPVVGGTSTLANAPVTISVVGDGTYTATTNNQGKWSYTLPKGTKGKVDVSIKKGVEEDVGSANVASLGSTPNATGTTVATLGAGSAATVGATTFALAGRFNAIDTTVVYDTASPSYGKVSGYLPAVQTSITGTDGFGDTLSVALSSNPSFSLNLASVWTYLAANGTSAGQSATIDVPDLAGVLTLNGTPYAFTGNATGTETFGLPTVDPDPAIGLDPVVDDYALKFDLNLGQGGTVSGTLYASGPEIFTDEPSPLAVLAVAMLPLLALRCRRRG
jgi:hypothetical protein